MKYICYELNCVNRFLSYHYWCIPFEDIFRTEAYSFQESFCEKCLVDLDIFQKEDDNSKQKMSDKPQEFIEQVTAHETSNLMFCPICRSEYRQGFTKCSDCGAELVRELPPEQGKEFIEYEEVFSTYNPGDIAFIRSILDGEEITYFFQGEHFNYVRPLVEPARLMVNKEQVETAKELLKDAKLSFMAINLDDDSGKEEEPE